MALVAWQPIWPRRTTLNEFVIRTHAGLRRCRILQRSAPRYLISTEMGIPTLKAHTVGLRDGTKVVGADVSIGNPHFVTFVDAADFACAGRPWQTAGEEICTHRDFPKGTNVEFVRVTDTNRIEFRIFERGVGPTLSSGTGSSASATASMEMRGAARTLTVVAEGGEQTVEWPQERLEPGADGACGNHRPRGVSAGMSEADDRRAMGLRNLRFFQPHCAREMLFD